MKRWQPSKYLSEKEARSPPSHENALQMWDTVRPTARGFKLQKQGSEMQAGKRASYFKMHRHSLGRREEKEGTEVVLYPRFSECFMANVHYFYN